MAASPSLNKIKAKKNTHGYSVAKLPTVSVPENKTGTTASHTTNEHNENRCLTNHKKMEGCHA